MSKKQILKEAEIEWGLKVGPKSKQREQTIALLQILSKAISQTREETIKEIGESLPEQAPPILDILGTKEEHNHNERIRARISGFNSCLGVIKEELNKLKK